MSVKDAELFVALAAIAKLVEDTSDGVDVLHKEASVEDLQLVDTYIDQVLEETHIDGGDVLLAAIAVVKAKINELKETKE